MDSYEALAASYDELTEDVEYEKRADFVEKLFLRAKRPVKSLLDLACGTGTMTVLFARRGYTVTGVDYSPEMLAQAQQKLAAINSPPLLLCLWRTRYRKNVKMLDYEVDLFRLQPDGAWERDFEEHHQRAYTVEELTAWLEEAGFTAIRTHGELKLRRANERDGRIYFSCIRK